MSYDKGNITTVDAAERETFVCSCSSSEAASSQYFLVPERNMEILKSKGNTSEISHESLVQVLPRGIKCEACGRFWLLDPEEGSGPREYMPVHADHSGHALFFYIMEPG